MIVRDMFWICMASNVLVFIFGFALGRDSKDKSDGGYYKGKNDAYDEIMKEMERIKTPNPSIEDL